MYIYMCVWNYENHALWQLMRLGTCGDNWEVTLFSWFHIYITLIIILQDLSTLWVADHLWPNTTFLGYSEFWYFAIKLTHLSQLKFLCCQNQEFCWSEDYICLLKWNSHISYLWINISLIYLFYVNKYWALSYHEK